ncbi:3-hydroxybutyryl-CoA dehydrogenase [Herbiconiux sp. UC225_62]|uniref:3-hydroxybutyryl-CoA dehydrogenase n=1 Tax=Herbiconiux sp. UC225_62 TaxID=3350168 RepID=UPI0036D22584
MTVITKVGVVGLGLMGSGIAEACARAELTVTAVEYDDQAVAAGLARVRASLARAVAKGKLDHDEAPAVMQRITATTDYTRLADVDLVIEAATENEDAKLAIFRRLDETVHESAILVSNTSSIPIARIAAATRRPDRVMGMHFFNPAPVQRLVELIPALTTSPETIASIDQFTWGRLGKSVIYAQDRAGFIVNALLVPYLLSAIRMLDGGHASREDIDAGMVQGCGHPMGPLTLVDLIGLDTVKAMADVLFGEYGDSQFASPPLLARMLESGQVGRKSGRGFYDYPDVSQV